VIGDGQDDIGTESDSIDSLDDLPPAPDEPKQGAIKIAFEDFHKAIAKKVQGLTSNAPQSASRRTWVNGVEDWANRVLDSSILKKRAEALNRLLNLLDRDPKAVLRKAIPFGGEEDHRGIGRRGSNLVDRDIDFRLGESGGRPGDYWDIPWDIQQQLLVKYRDLANRKFKLGRHRRAAYIFGNLLGDYYSAAQVLEEGAHYLEAASLHRDHLSQPHGAWNGEASITRPSKFTSSTPGSKTPQSCTRNWTSTRKRATAGRSRSTRLGRIKITFTLRS